VERRREEKEKIIKRQKEEDFKWGRNQTVPFQLVDRMINGVPEDEIGTTSRSWILGANGNGRLNGTTRQEMDVEKGEGMEVIRKD